MSELRRDPLHRRAVLVAEGRAARPHAEGMLVAPTLFEQSRGRIAVEHDPTCPFCPGNEHETPAESHALRDPGTPANGPGWRARIIGNRYPAVDGDDGLHEVLICAAEHRMLAGDLTATQWIDMWRLLRDRAARLRGRWAMEVGVFVSERRRGRRGVARACPLPDAGAAERAAAAGRGVGPCGTRVRGPQCLPVVRVGDRRAAPTVRGSSRFPKIFSPSVRAPRGCRTRRGFCLIVITRGST
ncbi:MAG: hypothetical protein QM811_22770 [Pirellulales bacterium]